LEGTTFEVPAAVAESKAKYSNLSKAQIETKIKQLDKQMYQHADNLEFEEAAKLRDEIQRLEVNYKDCK